MDKKDTRVVLKPEFQRELFAKLRELYPRRELAKSLNIARSALSNYQYYTIRSIPILRLEKIYSLLKMDMKEVTSSILKFYSFKESLHNIMKAGSDKRHRILKTFRDEIPKLSELTAQGYLDVEKWFLAYKKLIDFGARKFKSIITNGNKLLLKYENFSNGKQKTFKTFKTVLPRKIKIDKDFLYFFGLWLGDKAGGGRIGVVNKEPKINTETATLLQNYYQRPFFELYIDKNAEVPKNIKVDKITKKGLTGWAIGVYSVNSIFKRFFEYLEGNESPNRPKGRGI